MTYAYRCMGVVAPILCFIALIATMIFSYLAAADTGKEWGVYNDDTGAISDKYNLEITPAGWTFAIWGFIYAYQIILLIYWLTLLWRKNPVTDEPLYRSPIFMPPWITIFYLMTFGATIGWLFAWDNEILPLSLGLLAVVSITLYICMGISFSALASKKDKMLKEDLELDIRLLIGIFHNGLGMYAAWATIATLLNLGVVLTYEDEIGISQPISSSISLAALAIVVVAYIFLDHVVLEKYMRYLFTPYIVLHVALIGSIEKNWDEDSSNSIFTAGLLVIGAFATILKISLAIYRTLEYPIYSTQIEPTLE